MDYYAVLDLDVNCTEEEVKAQYRRLALQHHPDVNPGDEEGSTARLRSINEAYEVLSDPVKRRVYDLTVDKLVAHRSREQSDSSDMPSATAPVSPQANPYTGAVADARRRSERRTAAAAVLAAGFLILLLSRSPISFGHWNIPDTEEIGSNPPPMQRQDTVDNSAEAKARIVGSLQRTIDRMQPQVNQILTHGQDVVTSSNQTPQDFTRQTELSRLSEELTALKQANYVTQNDLSEAQTLELGPLQQSVSRYRTDLEAVRSAGENAARDIRELSPSAGQAR